MNPSIVVIQAAVMVAAALPCLARAAEVWPLPAWPTAEPHDVGLDEGRLLLARDYALTGGGSGYITRSGKLVMSWGDPKRRYDLKSTSKSIGVTALGLATTPVRRLGPATSNIAAPSFPTEHVATARGLPTMRR